MELVEQGAGAGDLDDAGHGRRRIVQLEGRSGIGGVPGCREEGVESDGVAEGDGREIDVGGADAVAPACGQCGADERGGGRVDLSECGVAGPGPGPRGVPPMRGCGWTAGPAA
ncbi:hypothetical protein SSP24_06810 [Streptomyces spinoverrucosus]|uniref:Uncharacterized protein n=1 Tax=Streptomyces spinoverrucosus TaxID=284043 RepID=A0A4Y3VDF7_9ACTN|nr:hypothetical protein SSP24_06810 [Streptomyces spinoverrucosus]GHB38731.1 hypothetical protein GCM10010397_05760 [Streptomyces spinoverrucosus]